MRLISLVAMLWLGYAAPSMASLCYNPNGAFSSGYNQLSDDIMNGRFNASSPLNSWGRYYSVAGHCRKYYRNGAQRALDMARQNLQR